MEIGNNTFSILTKVNFDSSSLKLAVIDFCMLLQVCQLAISTQVHLCHSRISVGIVVDWAEIEKSWPALSKN